VKREDRPDWTGEMGIVLAWPNLLTRTGADAILAALRPNKDALANH
jgi:hypothetical protein